MDVPEHVRRNRVQPHRFRHAQPIPPVSPRNPRIMHLTRDHAKRLAIQHELSTRNAKAMVRRILRAKLGRTAQHRSQQQQHDEQSGSQSVSPIGPGSSAQLTTTCLKTLAPLIHLRAMSDKDRLFANRQSCQHLVPIAGLRPYEFLMDSSRTPYCVLARL